MEVIVVRHTETQNNVVRVIQGQSDSPLTENGINLAVESFQFFKGKPIDRIISSPIDRAYKTASILCKTIGASTRRIIRNEGLKEIDLGKWTNKPIDELTKDHGANSYYYYKNHPQLFKPEEGESLFDLQNRVRTCFDRLVDKYRRFGRIVIVSHSVAIRVLLLSLENRSMEDVWTYRLPPATKTIIELENNKVNLSQIGF